MGDERHMLVFVIITELQKIQHLGVLGRSGGKKRPSEKNLEQGFFLMLLCFLAL
jgi:hypothetical protein